MKIKASVDVWHNVDIIRSCADICKPYQRSTRNKERTESIPRHVFMYTNSAPNSSCDDDYPIKWACSYCKYKNVRADTLLKVEHRVGTSLIKKISLNYPQPHSSLVVVNVGKVTLRMKNVVLWPDDAAVAVWSVKWSSLGEQEKEAKTWGFSTNDT